MGVLRYAPELASQIDAQIELPAGSEGEVEIRAASVVAVERLRDAVEALMQGAAEQQQQQQQEQQQQTKLLSIHLDWALWTQGEKQRDVDPPHHRTRTIYY
jgi:Potential Queuosine, Q, salvage protein family